MSLRYAPCRLCLFCLAIISIFVGPAFGSNFVTEFGTSTVSTSNLLNDSNTIYDAYSTATGTFTAYPLASLQIKISGEQTYYRETIGLSNIYGRLAVSFIPTKPDARLSCLISGSFNGRVYHTAFSGIDNNYGELGAALGYRLTPSLVMRSGVSFKATDYINDTTDYKRDLDFFWGANATLLGKNSLDLELGLARTNYTFKDANLTGGAIIPIDNPPPNPVPYNQWWLHWIPDSESNLWILYVSPRVSRPLGAKTGISLSYTIRNFQNYTGGLLWGLNTGYLSPWTTVWDGQNMSLNIKSFLIPKLIVKTGIGYWDKSFLVTSEKQKWDEFGSTGTPGYVDRRYGEAVAEDKPRTDFVTKVYLGIQLPLASKAGFLFEPSLDIQYTDNKSNRPLYDFTSFSVTTNIKIRF